MHLEIPQPSQLNQFSYGSKPWHPGFHTAIAGLLHRSAEEVGQIVFPWKNRSYGLNYIEEQRTKGTTQMDSNGIKKQSKSTSPCMKLINKWSKGSEKPFWGRGRDLLLTQLRDRTIAVYKVQVVSHGSPSPFRNSGKANPGLIDPWAACFIIVGFRFLEAPNPYLEEHLPPN